MGSGDGVTVLAGLAAAVREGLTAPRKHLPPRFFYDEVGSVLFEAICALPEYYLTRVERLILERHAGDLVTRLRPGVCIVELGAGSAVKTRLVIRALIERGDEVVYVPIDISEEAMRIAAANITSEFPSVRFNGVVDDWISGLERLTRMESREKLVLFLGSSIGNLERDEAARFLQRLRLALGPRDKVLVGTDMVKPVADLVAAYDDPAGVTAAFNRNILVRINRELGADFDVRAFRHEARWNEDERRIEMHLVARHAHRVKVAALELEVPFGSGESIHTENSHKFSPDDVLAMAKGGGFQVTGVWHDEEDLFRLNLMEAL